MPVEYEGALQARACFDRFDFVEIIATRMIMTILFASFYEGIPRGYLYGLRAQANLRNVRHAWLGYHAQRGDGQDRHVHGRQQAGKTTMLSTLREFLGNQLLRYAGSSYMATDRTGSGNDTAQAGALKSHILIAGEVTKLGTAKVCALTGTSLGAAAKNEKFSQV